MKKYGTGRSKMSPQSRLVAGIVLLIVPTVEIGGASVLSLLIADPSYGQNDLSRISGEQDMPTRACGSSFP